MAHKSWGRWQRKPLVLILNCENKANKVKHTHAHTHKHTCAHAHAHKFFFSPSNLQTDSHYRTHSVFHECSLSLFLCGCTFTHTHNYLSLLSHFLTRADGRWEFPGSYRLHGGRKNRQRGRQDAPIFFFGLLRIYCKRWLYNSYAENTRPSHFPEEHPEDDTWPTRNVLGHWEEGEKLKKHEWNEWPKTEGYCKTWSTHMHTHTYSAVCPLVTFPPVFQKSKKREENCSSAASSKAAWQHLSN